MAGMKPRHAAARALVGWYLAAALKFSDDLKSIRGFFESDPIVSRGPARRFKAEQLNGSARDGDVDRDGLGCGSSVSSSLGLFVARSLRRSALRTARLPGYEAVRAARSSPSPLKACLAMKGASSRAGQRVQRSAGSGDVLHEGLAAFGANCLGHVFHHTLLQTFE